MTPRVLIVEDKQIVAADLEARFARLGCQVIGTTASGEEAVQLASASLPHVVLMDVQLQGETTGTHRWRSVFVRNPEQMQAPGLSKPLGGVSVKSGDGFG